MALFGVGCLASVHGDRPPPSDPVFGSDTLLYPDPFEGLNRSIFVMNQRVDRWLFDPLTRSYRLVPAVVRRSVRRFFTNLNATSVIGNDLLQGELRDAAVVTARIIVNSTLGIAGLADPATPLGLPYHHSDFGQTLALAGVGCGPYFIVPLLGPTTLRDGFGALIDFAFRPTTYLFGLAALVEVVSIQGAATGFVERERNVDYLVALRDSSIDFYAALHSAYTQAREAAIRQRRPIRAPQRLGSGGSLSPGSGGARIRVPGALLLEGERQPAGHGTHTRRGTGLLHCRRRRCGDLRTVGGISVQPAAGLS